MEMAPAVPPVGPWQDAMVTALRDETPSVKTFSLRLALPTPYLPGQHFVVRLTAPDGYTAQRSYSVATPPGDGWAMELTVERLDDGEVSTFLHDEVVVGDTLEVRGPIGGVVRLGRLDAGSADRRRFGRRPAHGHAAPRPSATGPVARSTRHLRSWTGRADLRRRDPRTTTSVSSSPERHRRIRRARAGPPDDRGPASARPP